MYDHIAAHTVAGHMFYGMIRVQGPITTEQVVDDLRLIHATYTAEDLIDVVQTIPI